MGEVYRARDTRLGREVAIKVLPEAAAGDADQLAPLRTRGPCRGGSQPSEHRHHLRDRRARGHALHRDGAGRGPDAQGAARGGSPLRRGAARSRHPDRAWPREGARGGHRAPGPEAREPHGDERRFGEDPGLRPRQADASRHGRPKRHHPGRIGPGHRAVHVARAGGGSPPRPPLGPVLASGRSSTRWRRGGGPSRETRRRRRWRPSSRTSPSP